MFLESGSLTLGGTGIGEETDVPSPSKVRKSKKRKLGTTRGKV